MTATNGKRWARLLPAVFVTYSLAYVDRANYGFGAAAGMAHDLGIDAAASALLGALFFLGYFLFQVPAANYAERRSARQLVFWGLIAWGLLASAIGLLSSIELLYLDRFLLGAVESVVFPALLVFLTHWFTRAERSRANALLILGNPITVLWMSIVSGYLAGGLGWRGLFIAEGLPSVLWAFAWWALVRDRPKDAAWLGAGEREALERALAEEQRAMPAISGYGEAFRRPETMLLCAQYFLWSVGVYGFVLWLPSILKAGSRIGIADIGWLAAAPYALAAIVMVVASTVSDRTRNRRALIWPFLLVAGLAFGGSYALGTAHYWTSYGLLVIAGAAMYAPYGPFFAMIPELLPRNVAGGTMALVNSFGGLGAFAGTYAVGWLDGATGGPGLSFLLMAGATILSGALILALPRRTPSPAARPGVSP